MEATFYKDYSKPLSKEDIQNILDFTYLRKCGKKVFKAIETKDIKEIDLPRSFATFILNLDLDHWITLFMFYINEDEFKAYYIDSLGEKIPDNIYKSFEERGVEICEIQLRQQKNKYDSAIFSLKNAEIITDEIIGILLNCKDCELINWEVISLKQTEMINFFNTQEVVLICKKVCKKYNSKYVSSKVDKIIDFFTNEKKIKEKLQTCEIIAAKEREFFANLLNEKKRFEDKIEACSKNLNKINGNKNGTTFDEDYSKSLSKEDIQNILDFSYVRECGKRVFKAIETEDIKEIDLPPIFATFILNLNLDHWITLFVFHMNEKKFKTFYIDSLGRKILDCIKTSFDERGVEICEIQLTAQDKMSDSDIFSLKYAKIITDEIIAEVLNCKECKLKTWEIFSVDKAKIVDFFKTKQKMQKVVKMCKNCEKTKYDCSLSLDIVEIINSFTSEEKVKEKLENCEIIVAKEREYFANLLNFSYRNVNAFINFVETFALEDTFPSISAEICTNQTEKIKMGKKIKEAKKRYFSRYFQPKDLELIKAARSAILHGNKIKNPGDFYKLKKNEINVSTFFKNLEQYTKSMSNKIFKNSGDNSHDIQCDSFLENVKTIGEDGDFFRFLKNFLLYIYQSKEDEKNVEKIIFDLGVNAIPAIDNKNEKVRTLSNLRNELIHSFQECDTIEKKFKKIKKLTLYRSDLFKYFYAKVVHELLKDMPLDINIEILQKEFKEKLKDLQNDVKNINIDFVSNEDINSFEYIFQESIFPESDESIKHLVDKYLKYMFIVDKKTEVKDQIDDDAEEEEIKSSLQYKILNDCKRREIFEDFLELKKVEDRELTGVHRAKKELQDEHEKGKRNKLMKKLKEYGIEVDNFDTIMKHYVDATLELPEKTKEAREKIVSILSILKNIKENYKLSIKLIINLYEEFLDCKQKGIFYFEKFESLLCKKLSKDQLTESQKSNILNKICNLPDLEKIDVILGEKTVTELNSIDIIRNILAVFCSSYNRYKINFNNVEEAFNDEMFLNYLVSLNIKKIDNCKVTIEKHFVFTIIKKLIRVEYAGPYIAKLIIESNDDTLIEKEDFINLLKTLLKNNTYITYLKQLLSVKSKKVDVVEEFCNEILDCKDFNIDSINVVLEDYNQVKAVLSKFNSKIEDIKSQYLTDDEATEVEEFCNKVLDKQDINMKNIYAVLQDYKVILSKIHVNIETIDRVQIKEFLSELKSKVRKLKYDKEERVKAVEKITKQILKQLNSITYELHRKNGYDKVVTILETSLEIGKKLTPNDDLKSILLDAKYQIARSVTQLAVIESRNKENNECIEEKLNKALKILEGIKREEERNRKEEKTPKLLLISVDIAYTNHLLKKYAESYKSYKSLFEEIEKIALGSPCIGNNKFSKIENSKKYQKMLTSYILCSDEAKKYLTFTNIQSSMAFNKVCEGKELNNFDEALNNYKEALKIYQDLYNFKKENLKETFKAKDISCSACKIVKTKFLIGKLYEDKEMYMNALQYYMEAVAKGIQYSNSLKEIYKEYHPLFKASKTLIAKILSLIASVNSKLGSSNFYHSKLFQGEAAVKVLENAQANYTEAIRINEELKESPYYEKNKEKLKKYIIINKEKKSKIEDKIKGITEKRPMNKKKF